MLGLNLLGDESLTQLPHNGGTREVQAARFGHVLTHLQILDEILKHRAEICSILLRHHPCAVSLLGFIRTTAQLRICQGQDCQSPLLKGVNARRKRWCLPGILGQQRTLLGHGTLFREQLITTALCSIGHAGKHPYCEERATQTRLNLHHWNETLRAWQSSKVQSIHHGELIQARPSHWKLALWKNQTWILRRQGSLQINAATIHRTLEHGHSRLFTICIPWQPW